MSISRILVVEDNVDDVFFMRRALKVAAPSAEVDFVADGQAALDYLRGTGAFVQRAGLPLPDIVFLDLKLPYVFGLEVLSKIRSTATMTTLPVIVLTSSNEDRDQTSATALGIEAYLVKPPSAPIIAEVLQKLSGEVGPANAPPQPLSMPASSTPA